MLLHGASQPFDWIKGRSVSLFKEETMIETGRRVLVEENYQTLWAVSQTLY